MAAIDNSFRIRRTICEMVRSGHGLGDIQRRLSEESREAHISYASSLVRVRDELLAGKLKVAA